MAKSKVASTISKLRGKLPKVASVKPSKHKTVKTSSISKTLDRTVIAIPLLEKLNLELKALKKNPKKKREIFRVIIDINLEYPRGREFAREWVSAATGKIINDMGSSGNRKNQGINELKSEFSEQYMFAALEGNVIRELVERDGDPKDPNVSTKGGPRAVFHIWPDFEIKSLINKSISTVKADAAQTSFSAYGNDITWAVLDSGIQASHPHFKLYENLTLKSPLIHKDFTKITSQSIKSKLDDPTALQDEFGHGTHVAGIIAGALEETEEQKIHAYSRQRNQHDDETYREVELDYISGMAPKCKLLSLKVLDENGGGDVSNIIAAIAMIQRINGYGRRLLIHGVNLSVGYDFNPEWFACGQSPLCVEVDRLVRSGVVVVVAAGNTGFSNSGESSAGVDLTINDPGNAELAITVGSTHRDMPHVYGVSYFSSKGPTGDGRSKPDLVAPGERILSCAAGEKRKLMESNVGTCDYLEESGTSMAAPHVSGAIAAFLSIRKEFIGQPDKVKEIFLSTATDLKRERYFQGYGLVDLMRAIQSI